MTAQELHNLAAQDRFALIFNEEYEGSVLENIRELYRLCPATGILVRQTTGGITYHVAPLRYADNILKNGFRVRTGNDGDFLTYGGGVIYTYPSLAQYTSLNDITMLYFAFSMVLGHCEPSQLLTRTKRNKARFWSRRNALFPITA